MSKHVCPTEQTPLRLQPFFSFFLFLFFSLKGFCFKVLWVFFSSNNLAGLAVQRKTGVCTTPFHICIPGQRNKI